MRRALKIILLSVIAGLATAHASTLDMIGLTLLQATTTNLNGSGVRVGQPEASAPPFEVNPAHSQVLQSTGLFTYFSASGVATNFPNSAGTESGHADGVAGFFYGMPAGVATNVMHVDNYDADYFYNTYVVGSLNATDSVVNQSYIFGYVTNGSSPPSPFISISAQQSLDSQFDDYAAQFNALFVSGIGNGDNGGHVNPPATCYNGIGAGAYGGSSSSGPTLDNGRCKPDIIAPGDETSYSTPLIAGAAAVLLQAGLRGDGGNDTNAATDSRTVKALLLNGAVKPANWTNSPSQPLHFHYGAGVLNVFNAYKQLAGGKHGYTDSTTVSSGGAHPPTSATGSVSALSGWNFTNCTSSAHPATDAINHYLFNISNATFTATITLVWNRQAGQTGINDLNLFLYNCANSNLVTCSTSLVDNVEHIFVQRLPQGRYDLQVWKAGGNAIVSASETYALAWEFSSQALSAMKSATNLNLSWPVYPAGFAVESATNLSSPVWRTNGVPAAVFTNGQNAVSIPMTNAVHFFRLRTPNY